ncbi:Serine/threonine-protein kinase DCLK1 [Trichoplax sp. H2]|nr:Serine/threonine-protein kinase DCLK1 [Trichoplax sp. H2]|eukprot:RDD45335.1 Serine/threonine-protein kinase DCLK1 [Trichoplax sp. H2]
MEFQQRTVMPYRDNERRTVKVKFYKNGDQYFQGLPMNISINRYRSMEALLNELTRSISLPRGVRYVMTPDNGKKIQSVHELQDGKAYICSSFNSLSKIEYGKAARPAWRPNTKLAPLGAKPVVLAKPKMFELEKQREQRLNRLLQQPKIVTVVKSGPRPRKVGKIMLNKKTGQTFDQVLNDISETLRLPSNNRIKKLYTTNGKALRELSEMLGSDKIFIAVGSEGLKMSDLEEIMEEVRNLPGNNGSISHGASSFGNKKPILKPIGQEKNNPQSHQPVKTDDSTKRASRNRVADTADISRVSNANDLNKSSNNKLADTTQKSRASSDTLSEKMPLTNQNIEKDTYENEKDIDESEKNEDQVDKQASNDDIFSPVKDTVTDGDGDTHSEKMPLTNQNIEKDIDENEKDFNESEKDIDESEKNEDRVDKQASNDDIFSHVKDTVTDGDVFDATADIEKEEESKSNKDNLDRSSIHGEDNHERSSVHNEDNGINLNQEKAGDNEEKEDTNNAKDPATPVKLGDTFINKVNNKNINKSAGRNTPENNEPLPNREGTYEDYYVKGNIIGDGNFAEVFHCVEQDTLVEYALKLVHKSKIKGKESMIQDEINIMKKCRHKNIIRLIEVFDTQIEIQLVMELVKGGDLFDLISDVSKFTEFEASGLIGDLAAALQYLHKRSIIHRDLKPENLLITQNFDDTFTLKLGDFGLAVVVTEPLFQICGTPTYLAPEVLAETGYGLPADMWATGVINYIVLCGFPPFRSKDRNQNELFNIIKKGEFEYLSPYWDDISDTATDLVDNLLMVNPVDRYTAEQVLKHPWIVNRAGSISDVDLKDNITNNIRENFDPKKSFKAAALAVRTAKLLDQTVESRAESRQDNDDDIFGGDDEDFGL